MFVAGLYLQAREVDGATVDADGRTRFQALYFKAKIAQLVRKPFGRSLPYPTPTPGVFSDINRSVEEGAAGEHHRSCGDGMSHTGDDTRHRLAVESEGNHLVLPKEEIGDGFQHLTPVAREKHTVALRPGAPHGRSFGAIEHAELDSRTVGDDSRPSAKSVNLTDDLAFGHTAHSWIA